MTLVASKSKTNQQKVHFEWISIQKEVENDTKAREKKILTNNCSINSNKLLAQDDHILSRFISKFEYEKYFEYKNETEKDGTFHKKKKKSNQKKKGTNVDDFRLQNQILFQDADFELFSLDGYKMKYIYNFNYPICQYFYLLYWCIELLKGLKAKKNINPIIVLDGILSINRLMDKDIITNPSYIIGFKCIQAKLNALVSNDFFYNLLFSNPKYLIDCSFQNFDSEISLYDEQKEMIHDILNSIDKDKALLFANQHPVGQGKTFACAPLTNEISKKYDNSKTILFACSNPLVRKQMAVDIIIGEKMHLWLAKHGVTVDKNGQYVNRYLLRPFKSCFPNTWKKKYKENDDRKIGSIEKQWEYYISATKRIPNIIITDLPCCLEILNSSINEENRLIAFIDEFITDKEDAKIMARICSVLPKQTILLSSVLPKFENIPTIVSSFCKRHKSEIDSSIKRVSSKNINIPVAIINQDGFVHFPHHYVHTKENLILLISSMKKDPRIRRCYPASYVYYWSKEMHQHLPTFLFFENQFQNIGQLNQNDACEYVILILGFLVENFHLYPRFQEYKPRKMTSMSIDTIFTKDTHKYDSNGKTLCIFEDCLQRVEELTMELFKESKKIECLSKEVESEKKSLRKELEVLQKSKTKQTKQNGQMMDKRNSHEEISVLQEKISNLNISIKENMILNHVEHYKRFHESTTEIPKSVSHRQPIVLHEEYFRNFPDNAIYQMLSGIGSYDFDNHSRFQQELTMDIYNSFLFFCSTKKIIYGTNLPNISTIVIPSCIAQKLSISEIYQYIGRAGRRGVSSNHADIILFDQETLKIALGIDDTHEKETDVELELIKFSN